MRADSWSARERADIAAALEAKIIGDTDAANGVRDINPRLAAALDAQIERTRVLLDEIES